MKLNINKITRELNGYKVIYLPDHHRAMHNDNWEGFVYEHIVVAEEYGEPLKDGEVIHHLDGNRSNNRYSNLLVLNKSQHGRLHAWLSAGAPGIERFRENGENSLKAKVIPTESCVVCGRTLQDKQRATCSESCRDLSCRKVQRPSKSQLIKDVAQLSVVKVGAKYGVSDNAIRKWMKTYGITKPTISPAESTLPEGSETTGEV